MNEVTLQCSPDDPRLFKNFLAVALLKIDTARKPTQSMNQLPNASQNTDE